jgi:hypothetical protein
MAKLFGSSDADTLHLTSCSAAAVPRGTAGVTAVDIERKEGFAAGQKTAQRPVSSKSTDPPRSLSPPRHRRLTVVLAPPSPLSSVPAPCHALPCLSLPLPLLLCPITQSVRRAQDRAEQSRAEQRHSHPSHTAVMVGTPLAPARRVGIHCVS